MTAGQYCKSKGITLAEVSRRTGVGRSCLYHWHKWKPELFETLVAGAIALKAAESAR